MNSVERSACNALSVILTGGALTACFEFAIDVIFLTWIATDAILIK